jgi:hypothetical protein
MDESDKVQMGVVRAYLCQIDDHKYLSLEGEESSPSGDPPTKRVSYIMLVIDQIDAKVKLRALTSGWLSAKLKGEPAAIKHEVFPVGDTGRNYYRLTATTEELRAFYLAHLTERSAWYPFEFTKKP